jgi:transposase
MAPYSMDLRKRVVRAWDAGMDAESVAAKYEVSRAWVHRLVQRRRETGSIAPRQQTKFRGRVLKQSSGQIGSPFGVYLPADSPIHRISSAVVETRRPVPGPPFPKRAALIRQQSLTNATTPMPVL